MKRLTSQIIAFAAILAIAGIAGCKHNGGKKSAGLPWDPNEPPPDESGKIVISPTPNAGTLNVPIGSFSPGNNDGCFPTAQGWNKYYVTFYFLGPNVNPPPNPNNYPNPDNINSVTIDTMASQNGSTLDTGILIVDNLNPTSKVCNDDAAPSYTPNPKLSKVTFSPTGNGKKYRVGVFYKSSTAGGLTNIVVHWSYP